MINIIDAYESDAEAENKAAKKISREDVTDEAEQKWIRKHADAEACRFGGFVGAWTKTAGSPSTTSTSSGPTRCRGPE